MRKYIAIILLGTVLSGPVSAGQPSGGDFVLVKSTLDGGGGTSSGGDFIVTGTIGQPDASAYASTGAQYVMVGGFWAQITGLIAELIFKDGFE